MKTVIDGHEFEGTPEEIATYIKLFGEVEQKDGSYTPPVKIPDVWNQVPMRSCVPDCCLRCSNYGKGPCCCVLPYMTSTGWRGNYTINTTTTYTSDISNSLKGSDYTTSSNENVRF